MTRSPFDPLVDAYDTARPRYPPELYDALNELAGPLAGGRLVDVGAGTGIATRELVRRGAHVVAVDLGERMLRRLLMHGVDTGAPGSLDIAVVADAHALPVRTGSCDVVTYAQAFHWTRPVHATQEARRVLRSGGALAVWWNDVDAGSEAWWQRQQDRLESMNPRYRRDYRQVDDPLAAAGLERTTHAELRWSREVTIDEYLTSLRSRSYVAALADREPEFLAAERVSLAQAFPAGVMQEPFRVRLWVARTP